MNRPTIVGAIEIGTSKVVVLVAEVSEDRRMNIIGRGHSTNTGMKKGDIVDLRRVSDCTHAAILNAEKDAGEQIQRVYLSLSGAHLWGFRNTGVTAITSNDGVVTHEDINRAAQNAKGKALEHGEVYIQHLRTGFLLDGRPMDNPLDKVGDQLEVKYWHVVADAQSVSEHIEVINGFGLDVNDIVISSIASGSLLATDEEKRQGVLVVDIGQGTTDFVLYRGRRAVHTGVIPVGGDHVTNDLALGLRVKQNLAERLKLRSGKALVDKEDRTKTVPLIGDLNIGDSLLPLMSVNKIVHARLEELFIILKNKLGSALTRQNLPGGVILTGGVSRTPRIAELAETTLGVPVVTGECPDWVRDEELRGPEFTTALGLLYNALHDREKPVAQPRKQRLGLLGKVHKLFG
jgi:cell division protein FtsA